MKMNRQRRQKFERQTYEQLVEHARQHSDVLQASKRTSESSGSRAKRSLLSVFAVLTTAKTKPEQPVNSTLKRIQNKPKQKSNEQKCFISTKARLSTVS